MMSESPYVFDVDQHNFASVVVENSQRAPVLVDFWADWCQPCQTLTPLLTKLAQEYRGGFILAKVNADAEQGLAGHFRVRSLPTVMVVWQGQIVDQIVGVQPESAYRAVIDQLRANPGDQFTVMAGPQEANGYTWFQIRSDDGAIEGWAADGTGAERWISPLE